MYKILPHSIHVKSKRMELANKIDFDEIMARCALASHFNGV
jgi:hypothetical protein